MENEMKIKKTNNELNIDFLTNEGDESINTIYVIGDSTVSSFNSNSYYYPRYGYGTMLNNFFDNNKYKVKNLALSGRSSKSFIKDEEYEILLNSMKKGDFLIIGFGHNDEKFDEERYTSPNGNYKDKGSFANSLYENYIKKAEELGCRVILCTPIVRRTTSSSWNNVNIHITEGTSKYEGGNYSQSILKLGQELKIPVIDMTNLTKKLYEDLGQDETIYFHAWTSKNPSSVDNTHTNIYGAVYNSYLITREIKNMNIDLLSDAVLDNKIKFPPSKEEVLYVDKSYKEKEYDSNFKESSNWEKISIWRGTVFGSVGKNINKEDFYLGKDKNNDINICVKNNKGKISEFEDGIAMYYYKIPVNKTFTLSASACINNIFFDEEVSFGLMARDDMYIDYITKDTLGDYIACGPLKLCENVSWNCFARKGEALTKGGNASKTKFNKGECIDLKIESNLDGYSCKLGEETIVTGGFDFALTRIDPNNIYVGMFVSKNADITFKNIKLIIDGKDL